MFLDWICFSWLKQKIYSHKGLLTCLACLLTYWISKSLSNKYFQTIILARKSDCPCPLQAMLVLCILPTLLLAVGSSKFYIVETQDELGLLPKNEPGLLEELEHVHPYPYTTPNLSSHTPLRSSDLVLFIFRILQA